MNGVIVDGLGHVSLDGTGSGTNMMPAAVQANIHQGTTNIIPLKERHSKHALN